MKRSLVIGIVSVAALAAFASGALFAQSSPALELRTAVELEKAKGETSKAIEIYRKLSASTDLGVATKAREALARLGDGGSTDEGFGSGATALPFKTRDITEYFPDRFGTNTISRDGRLAVYQKLGESFGLFARNLTNGRETRIGDLGPSLAVSIALAPDAEHAVVLRNRPMMQKDPKLIVFEVKANGRRSDIALAPIAFGAGAMSFDQMPWSPDGAWLPYLGPTADPNVAAVQVWSVKTGQSRPLGVEVDARGWMKWSPDGQRLAIRVQRSAAHVDEVRIVTLATGESHVLAGPGFGVVGKWTTNDRLVLRHANPQNPSVTDVLMFPVAGGASIKICAETTGGDVCGVSWNGRYVLRLSSDTKRYFIREIPDGKEQPVTRASGEETGMFFSPDDRLLFFYSNRDGHWAPYVATADRFPIEKPVKIGELNSAPGNSLASLNGITGNVILGYVVQDGNVSRLELDPRTGRAVAGASMERLTQDAQYNDRPVMSPDGTLIAYRFRNYGKGGIGVMDASGANEQHLLEFPRPLSGPLFWRSKDEVLFAAGSGPDRSVSALNIRTGAVSVVRQLHIEAGWEYVPGRDEVLTAPDGPAAAGAPVFEAVSLATGTKRVIKAGTAAGDVIDLWFVSPDGKQIAYTVWRHSGPETRTELRVMNIDGTGDRVLIPMGTDELAPAAWSRDGRFILYDPDYGGERARVLNVATGESWALLERGLSWDSEGSWAPDGSFLVVTTSESRRVWQMLEGITYDAVAKLMKK